MVPVITLIVIALSSLLAVRIATKALTMTGLSYDTASFQSYSAFFGVGFTTREAEMVVNHPVRRRIIRDLILVGNVGLTSSLATLVASMMQGSNQLHPLLIVGLVVVAAVGVSYLGRVRWVNKTLDRLIESSLVNAGLVRALDYELLLRVDHGYCVSEYVLEQDNPLIGRRLRDSRPWDEGVVILAIRRNDELLPGIPNREDTLEKGDIVVVYGQEKSVKKLMQIEACPTSPSI
jgi:NhaP-type Na+/H+ and K+/H+ antiporter